MITKKTYIPGKPRNKKLTNVTSGTANVGKTEFNQVAGESHTHPNKGVLDQITEAMLIGALRDLITSTDTGAELTDENYLSSLRTIKEITERSISKTKDDTASGIITFLKGLTSEELARFLKGIIAKEVSIFEKGLISEKVIDTIGLVARAGVIPAGSISAGLSEVDETDTEGAIVQGAIEEGETGPDGDQTLGSLSNVDSNVDETDAYDMILARSRGATSWYKKPLSDFHGKDGLIVYPTMFLNPLTGRLILQIPTSTYENRFAVENGHLIIKQ